MPVTLEPRRVTADEVQLAHTSKLTDSLDHMRLTGQVTDVTLFCKGDQELKAHMCVLSAVSEYFRNLSAMKSFLFVDFDIESMRVVVKFLYTGQLVFSPNTEASCFREVMKIGRDLELQFLIDESLRRLAESVDYLELYRLSLEYHSSEVASNILQFLAAEFDRVIQTDEIVRLDLEVLKRVLQNVKMVKASMDNIVGGILRWSQADCNRKTELGKLMALIDLSSLSDDCLTAVLAYDTIKEDHYGLTLLLQEKVVRLDRRLNMCAGNHQHSVRRLCTGLRIDWLPKLSRWGFGDPC